MKTKIVHLTHGDPELWTHLGQFLVSREVHKELGGPIYSSEGTHWWVALEGVEVVGFASMRPTKAGVWFDYAYVVEGARGKGVHGQMAKAREKLANTLHPETPTKIAVRSDRWKHYKRRGWTVDRERGSWVYGSKGGAEE